MRKPRQNRPHQHTLVNQALVEFKAKRATNSFEARIEDFLALQVEYYPQGLTR
ncbi:hypothetical protein VCHA54O485_100031 [Vibrio chagasii]|nr:hypothetical protein VCHA54O485_100031 [Vibrio chagasii]CAH7167950.1 hypothetical protein VCHA54P501_120031 [Vibrio chagasii]CAH7358894.1 hypothetical protein VCHA55P509_70031 [Vibrio chagasii]